MEERLQRTSGHCEGDVGSFRAEQPECRILCGVHQGMVGKDVSIGTGELGDSSTGTEGLVRPQCTSEGFQGGRQFPGSATNFQQPITGSMARVI